MPYVVNRYNGLVFSEVPDQTVDSSSCDLSFVGKNYAGYGELINENFLYLLENFRGDTPPRKSIPGQLWYDELNNKIKFKSSDSQFRSLSITDVSATPPTGLLNKDTGNIWYDTVNKQINVWDGTDFVLIGPELAVGFNETKLSSGTIRDNSNIQHELIRIVSDGTVIGTISSDEFEIGTIDAIPGFTRIKQGVTLINTPNTGVTSTGHRFWGTSSNSEKFQGLTLSDFVLRSPTGSTFNDNGVTLGDDSDLKIHVVDGDKIVIENQLGNTIRIRIKTGATNNDVAVFSNVGMIPAVTESYDLGSSSFKWREVHSDKVFSNTVGTLKGNVIATDDAVLLDANLKRIYADSFGAHEGNIRANDATEAYNSSTKTFTGVTANITTVNADTINLVNRLNGDIQGDVYANDGSIAYNAGSKTFVGTLSGNASTASKLASPKFINGVAFDGSVNITIEDSSKINKTGDTVSGNLTLNATPTDPLHVVNKQYVDNAIAASKDIYLSLDIRGLNTVGSGTGTVVSVLNVMAPVANFQPGNRAFISGTQQNVSSSASVGTGGWIGITYVRSVSVSTTVNNPSRNNDLVYRVNSSGTSWEYVSG